MKTPKKSVLIWFLLLCSLSLAAASDLWRPGEFALSPYLSYRVRDVGHSDGRLGGGLALGYSLTKAIVFEVETLSEGYTDRPVIDSLEEAGANFRGYLPLRVFQLAPYVLVGYTRNLQVDENRMNAGAGVELRGGRVHAFVDGRWTHDFVHVGHALFRVGVGARF